jgi:hypothetical protein
MPHTPASWFSHTSDDGWKSVIDRNNHLICSLPRIATNSDQEANLRLLERAPELLGALEEITDLIATYHLDTQQDVFDSSYKAKDLIKRIKDNQ